MRTPIVAGNWKMNGSIVANRALLEAVVQGAVKGVECVVCVPYPYLDQAAKCLAGSPVALGAQTLSEHASGAFTGDVSAAMLAEFGCRVVLVGHSERRQIFGETDAQVAAKFRAALGAGITPMLCIGETEAQRAAGETVVVLDRQLAESLPEAVAADRLVVAYEPVWAIGTGKTATLADIAEAHAAIGRRLAALAPDAGEFAILYGGSVKPDNARQIMAVPGVAGVLVGGASLDPAGFWAIYQGGGGA